MQTRQQSCFLAPAKQLDKLITKLESLLSSSTALPGQQQHWVLFSAMAAYLCCRHCYEALDNTQRVQQVCALTHLAAPCLLHPL